MKTATTFESEFTKSQALLVDGVPHLSITGATKLMYGASGGSSLVSFRSQLAKIAGLQTPVAATDFSLFPGILPVCFDRPQGGKQNALAMTQELFIEMLWYFAEKNTAGGKRAKVMLKSLAGVSLDLILRKEAGLISEEAQKEIDPSFEKFFKAVPGNEKADPINDIKQLLIANGQKDKTKRMGVLVNELTYNRLPAPIYEELENRFGGYRRASRKTNWQHLSPEAQKRIEEILVVAKVFIEDEMADGQIFNFAPVIQKLDRVMPRHRSSGYAAIN